MLTPQKELMLTILMLLQVWVMMLWLYCWSRCWLLDYQHSWVSKLALSKNADADADVFNENLSLLSTSACHLCFCLWQTSFCPLNLCLWVATDMSKQRSNLKLADSVFANDLKREMNDRIPESIWQLVLACNIPPFGYFMRWFCNAGRLNVKVC